LLTQQKVHVIISDQRMPGMTGVEFLSQAKELYPSTVRMILSGYADLTSVTDAINHGAIYKFLTKPWENETLRASVLDAFQHYELTQQRNALALKIQESNVTMAQLSLELSELLAKRESQIEHISRYDQLTNLPNRSLFIDKLNEELLLPRPDAQLSAILLLDLDKFNLINETYGNSVGDTLLQSLVDRLTLEAGEENTVARIGDDEFGYILTKISNPQDAEITARKILDSITREPVLLGSDKIQVTACLGISLYPTDGPDSNSLIKHANTALRYAKKQGTDTIQRYSDNRV
jgi:diguanylate cyclase (GGDEF)-like protein